ncbi:hypothetical protein L2E82_07932 [Cichorium intybus]|uniref:Uncharacterized protein n=1 Tax=Cichorium intybus TaxID=13427 RepID=A0ACB9G4M1_CICIN|nr:hypothetical protein L2E82_07932 [Cichorium intybus]
MGKSTTSCFKIISCGGSNESVDRDDIDVSSENKGPDKRGWSFRKKSARHRVLSNTVITETPLENKASSTPVTVTSEPQAIPSISEKTHDSIWTEELPSITKDATVSLSTIATEPSCEDDNKSESVPDESAILVIQAAVRRFLAQRELVKHKNVVKLQAAVRGHLVRNHAVGTLKCVQAIVKMQALVRARRANLSSEINSDPKYVSIEKLLSNSLARQLLESAPKNKQINIKCVPSKSDSAWNWLERWMSVSSPETVESRTPEQNQDQDQEKVNNTENQVESVIPDCESMELEMNADGKEDLVDTEEKSNERKHEEENPQPINATNTHTQKSDDLLEDSMDLVLEKPVSETESKRVTKRLATDQPDSEGRKSVFGSRKASNPAFIAAQSRFEELTSKNNHPLKSLDSSKQENDEFTPEDTTPSNPSKPINNSSNLELNSNNSNPSKSPDSSKQENDDFTPEETTPSNPSKPTNNSSDHELDSKNSNPSKSSDSSKQENDDFTPQDTTPSDPSKPVNNSSNQDELTSNNTSNSFVSSKQENDDRTPEDTTSKPINNSSKQDNDVISPAREEYLVSECGTELSITSTLDSPDQSEVENKNLPEDSKIPNEETSNNNIKEENPTKYVTISVPEKTPDIELAPDSDSVSVPPIPESSSPRSHITATESQGTPNSQLSTKKTNKKASSQKRKSWSTSKKSTVDSGLRASLENLPKESKPGKRRNSFGSPRPENSDHEGSNGSIPSYMQATESARAKAIASVSPKSSPDVQDKETYLKKRHSLPGGARQGSPRIQRSMSQALESTTTKGNGSQERKWQR